MYDIIMYYKYICLKIEYQYRMKKLLSYQNGRFMFSGDQERVKTDLFYIYHAEHREWNFASDGALTFTLEQIYTCGPP